MKNFAFAAALAAGFVAVPASADVNFSLQNVVFDDGQTATGSFVTEDAFTKLLNASISTTAGTVTLGGFISAPIPAYTYSDATYLGSGLFSVQSGGFNNQQQQVRLLGPDNRALYLTVPTFGTGTK